MDDRGIIALFNSRDDRAISEFERIYRRLCMTIARNITGDVRDAEECVNDTFLRLWNSIPPQNPQSLAAYAGRIVRNLALNRAESNNAQKRSAILVELDECIPDGAIDIDNGELGAYLNRFLSELPPLSAKVFVRRYWYSEPVGELSAMLGISANRASKLLAGARKKLREFLDREGYSR